MLNKTKVIFEIISQTWLTDHSGNLLLRFREESLALVLTNHKVGNLVSPQFNIYRPMSLASSKITTTLLPTLQKKSHYTNLLKRRRQRQRLLLLFDQLFPSGRLTWTWQCYEFWNLITWHYHCL